jgi:hypothetical protein
VSLVLSLMSTPRAESVFTPYLIPFTFLSRVMRKLLKYSTTPIHGYSGAYVILGK